MMYYVELLQNSTILIFSVTVLILLTAIALVTLLVRQGRCLGQLRAMSDSLSYLHDSFVRTNLNLEEAASRLQALELQYSDLINKFAQNKVELARIAEAVGGESQLTKAIDLARGGSDANEITLATGLGEDEANAIVKFHGSSKR